MAELTPKTINELPLASALGANDLLPISSGSEAKRLPGSAVINESAAGYCKMPDGTLIQYGFYEIPSGAARVLVNFPLSFVNNNYSFTATPAFGEARDVWLTFYNNSSNVKGSIYVYRQSSPDSVQGFCWLAIGRWK